MVDKDSLDIKKRHRHDLILMVSVLLLCALFFLVQRLYMGGQPQAEELYAVISLDGDVIFRCRLSEFQSSRDEEELREASEIYDEELLSFSKEGVEVRTPIGYNIISCSQDEEGSQGIYCIAADCPDKVCMDTGLIVSETEPIVCLPHRLIARLER